MRGFSSLAASLFALVFATVPAMAQGLVPYELTLGGDKGTKAMPLRAEVKDGKVVGYKCQQAALEALKPGDKTAFIIPARTDAVKLWDDMRKVTVVLAEQDGESLQVTLKEPVKLGTDKAVAKLSFRLNGGWYRLEKAE